MANRVFILGAGLSVKAGAAVMNNFLDVAEDLLDHRDKEVYNQVDLAPESAARETQGVVLGLFGSPFFPAPAAAREARTDEPSMHQRSQSILPCLSIRKRNQHPVYPRANGGTQS